MQGNLIRVTINRYLQYGQFLGFMCLRVIPIGWGIDE
jgi:hypothetical protein